MFSIFVTVNVEPERVEAFKEASLGDARGSVRDEPDCFRFDIHQDTKISSRFYLHEVYRNEEAFQAHLQSPHFTTWLESIKPFFDRDLRKITMKTVFPPDEGWEKQKPALLNW